MSSTTGPSWVLDVPSGWAAVTWADADGHARLDQRRLEHPSAAGADLLASAAEDLRGGAAMVAWTAGPARQPGAVTATITLHVGTSPSNGPPDAPVAAAAPVPTPAGPVSVSVRVSEDDGAAQAVVTATVGASTAGPVTLVGRTRVPALADALVRTLVEVAATFAVEPT